MITKNPMQLKALIKNKAAENNISAQIVMQNYMLERLLERISISEYKNNFILKGGFLIAAIVGLDTRATMDLDTTIKGFPLTHENIGKVFEEICAVKVNDDISFTILRIADIRGGDEYPGVRVSLTADYAPLKVPLTVDLTTGDKITPREVNYLFSLMFDERTISIKAYNIETVLAEKLETVLSRNTASTRPRDLYDIHILYILHNEEYAWETLKQALESTVKKRGSTDVLTQYKEIMDSVKSSPEMKRYWLSYQNEFEYAREITFEAVCSTVTEIMNHCVK